MGHKKFIYENSRGAREHEKFIPVWIKWKRWRPKKRSSGQKFPQILVIVSKFLRFFTNSLVKTEIKKKKVVVPKVLWNPLWVTKIMKLRAVNTHLGVLGLDLHSGSYKPVNFFGAQSSLGGHNFRLEGHGPGMPPEARGLKQSYVTWTRRWVWCRIALEDWVIKVGINPCLN